MPVFESRTELKKVHPQQVFEYIVRPANLQHLSPPEHELVFIQPPEIIELGSRLKMRVRGFGMIQLLEYEIVEFQPQERFREKLITGPIPHWVHDYIVETQPDGMVVLVNRIEFEPPKGLIGLLVTADKILDSLEDGFAHRREALQKVFS